MADPAIHPPLPVRKWHSIRYDRRVLHPSMTCKVANGTSTNHRFHTVYQPCCQWKPWSFAQKKWKPWNFAQKKVKTMEHVNNIIDLPIWSHTRGFCFSMTRGPSAHLNKHQGPGHGSNRTTNPHPPDVSLRLAFTLFINSMVSKSYKEWIKNTFYIYNRTPVATAHDQRGMRKYASI